VAFRNQRRAGTLRLSKRYKPSLSHDRPGIGQVKNEPDIKKQAE